MPEQYFSPTPQEPISGALAAALQKQAGPARTQPLGAPYPRFLRNPPD